MLPEHRIETLKQMLSLIDQQTSMIGNTGTIEVSHYTCEERLTDELNTLFHDQPILVAHASQLKEPNSFITLDIGNTPILVNRDRSGVLHAFINSCRHRGAKLTDKPCGKAKAFKCPYHAWSYLDDGSLKFVPNKEAFPTLDLDQHGLKELPVTELAGFIWVIPSNKTVMNTTEHTLDNKNINVQHFLAEIDIDLENFGLKNHVVRVSDIQRPKCNWKLVIDAFSEGYHLKTLHKDSVEPFFLEHGTVFQKMGKHARSVGARKDILKAKKLPESEWKFRDWTTPFYTLFPNTVLVFHPDWVSRITVFPDGTDQCIVFHDMLVPEDADLKANYWDKTFNLINQQVFAAEDIAICESIQSVARSGADTQWITGGLESPVLWFHQECNDAIKASLLTPELIFQESNPEPILKKPR